MRDKLVKLAGDITEGGGANLTRLTVLKRWFDGPRGLDRMRAFGAWMARRAITKGLKSANADVAPLFRDARTMLRGRDRFRPTFSAAEQEQLRTVHGRLRNFQNTYRQVPWTTVREIENWDLFLAEEGLALLFRYSHPADAYDLAAAYCRNYDPSMFHALNAPSVPRILAIARFMGRMEAAETRNAKRD